MLHGGAGWKESPWPRRSYRTTGRSGCHASSTRSQAARLSLTPWMSTTGVPGAPTLSCRMLISSMTGCRHVVAGEGGQDLVEKQLERPLLACPVQAPGRAVDEHVGASGFVLLEFLDDLVRGPEHIVLPERVVIIGPGFQLDRLDKTVVDLALGPEQ